MSVRNPSWLISILTFSLCACSSLTEPGAGSVGQPAQTAQVAQPAKPAPPPVPVPAPDAPAAPAEAPIKASHILIAYQGALRAAPTVTRTKEEAKALATRVAVEARKGGDFEALALKYSDDPTAKSNKGSLGQFGRGQMVKPFADAAFALKPQQIEPNPVETAFGFHVIKRTE